MVAFKKLFLLTLSLASSARLSLSAPASGPRTESLEKRATQSTLEWSPQGRFRFLLPLAVPQNIYSALFASTSDLSQQLAYDFRDWVHSNNFDAWSQITVTEAIYGGLWSKQADATNTFGIGFQWVPDEDLPFQLDIGEVTSAFVAWATQGGGVCNVVQRANDFFDLTNIGAHKTKVRREIETLDARSQTPFCPNTNKDLLQYYTSGATNTDDLRYIAVC